MEPFKLYRKKEDQMLRPFIEGEDTMLLSITAGTTPKNGGMVSVNKNDPADQWYITQEFFEDHYELAE